MATPKEKLAESLSELQKLQDQGVVAIKSNSLSRAHRERLLENNFLQEVQKGWYIAISPENIPGDTMGWYSSYWDFCSQYLTDRFGKEWCLYPEQSLLIHAGNTTVPRQLMVRAPGANNQDTPLLHATSLFLLKADMPGKNEMTEKEGLSMYTLPASLIRCSPNTFTQNSTDARTGLSLIRDASEVLSILLDGGHTVVAGRLAGAFRNIGKERIADTIIDAMKKARYDTRETDPFDAKLTIPFFNRVHSPYENRIRAMWATMREKVLPHFPPAPGIPDNTTGYLKAVENVYVTDAYHSLSIEKYKVTPELIERVRTGAWNAKGNEDERRQRDAMAARGYYDAFKAVEKSIERVLKAEKAGAVADEDHGIWYRELFGPSVAAGLLKASDLAGYRTHQVYIGGSMHTPLNREAVREAMPALFDLLTNEKEASVRAVLGHFVFVYIHPYMDGNGRMGRFLMNVMMASGGYPWTIIPVEQRDHYMQSLEAASVKEDIEPFARFIAYLAGESMKGKPVAKI